MEKTLGGDRLGSGKRMKVDLHGYERSTHNLSYLWRSTMSAGTLVPFIKEVALPGDTFDINLDVNVMTHPTVGPLFGSYKVQLDVFSCPIRLYNGQLHNNKLGIGMNMAQVKLPTITLKTEQNQHFQLQHNPELDYDNSQINPSCILAYLGIRGIGYCPTGTQGNMAERDFNGIPLLAYWDIYKNYYANKQEANGYVVHQGVGSTAQSVTSIEIAGNLVGGGSFTIDSWGIVRVNYSGPAPSVYNIVIGTSIGNLQLSEYLMGPVDNGSNQITGTWNYGRSGQITVYNWNYNTGSVTNEPTPAAFPLKEIDEMRESILNATSNPNAFDINAVQLFPYRLLLDTYGTDTAYIKCQEGLGLKTYNSDLFNNWLDSEWIDGANGISQVTSVDTSGGYFTIDTLNLSKKVYNMLNRIAVSGGTYDDWLDAVYTHERYLRAETPIYCGGLTRELAFQEVISNATTGGVSGGTSEFQPLGTLAGRGVLTKHEKGGHITIKVDEPSYIMGIVSITPRIDYSQGNKWDMGLLTMDDFHKPALDEIGFQDLITEQMAWWDTRYNGSGKWEQKSAGKQPAWINYMTNVNQVYGNFAIKNNEMYMTLNRRYEFNEATESIKDLTTYIDPRKYNFIFAQTNGDAMNFWVQISNDIIARRKMSAKVMPNL